MLLIERPTYHPHCCLNCGTHKADWFMSFPDQSAAMAKYFQPLYEGNIMICSKCIYNLATDIQKVINNYQKGKPSKNEPRDNVGKSAEADRDINVDNPKTERDNSESAEHSSDAEPTVVDPKSAILEFRGRFGART